MFHRSVFAAFVSLIVFSFSMSMATGNNLPVARASSDATVTEAQDKCPKVRVTSPDTVKAGDSLTFVANVTGGDQNVSPTYNWSVSAGSISSGQGTSVITVETKDVGGQTVTATVELGGYDRTCSVAASATTSVEQKPEAKKITEYGAVTVPKEQEVLGAFTIELQNDPISQGYIISYGGPTSTDAKINAATKRAKDYMVTKRGIDSTRLTVVNGGKRKAAVTELWLVPNGATPPTPTPDAAPAKTSTPKPKTPPATKKKA